jgi:uncharacterized protein with HEPN domain
MSKRFVEFYIVDVLTAIDRIKRYTSNFKETNEFVSDEKCFDATMRELEITGEAIKHLLASDEMKHLTRSEWRIIVDFRNVITHEYFGIDVDEVFKVVKEDINVLEKEVLELIKNLKDKTKLYEALECAIDDLKKMHRKEGINYLIGISKKMSR